MIRWSVNNKWERLCKEAVMANSGVLSRYLPEEPRKISIRVLGVQTKIRTRHLPNTCKKCYPCNLHHWRGWCRGNTLGLHSRDSSFESRQGYRLSWLRGFLVFLSSYTKIPSEYLGQATTSSFHNFSISTDVIQCRYCMRCYISQGENVFFLLLVGWDWVPRYLLRSLGI
jgi:hypothetical protein